MHDSTATYDWNVYDSFWGDPTTLSILPPGDAGSVNVYESSMFEMHGSEVHSTYLYSDSKMVMDNGQANDVRSYGDSVAEFSGGAVGDLRAYDDSNVTWLGGSVNWLRCYNSASVFVDANIDAAYVQLSNNSSLTVKGLSFTIDGVAAPFGTYGTGGRSVVYGTLVGYRHGGGEVHLDLTMWNSSTITLVPAPEPSTCMILGFAGLRLLRRRGRRY